MSFSDKFIKRPVLTTVCSILIVLVGLISIPSLPIANLPNIANPLIQVSAVYGGANAEVTEQAVTNPLEQQIHGVPGISYISSNSDMEGNSTISVYFDETTDIDIDQVNVQNRVTLAMPQLPSQVQKTGVAVKQSTPSILLAYEVGSSEGQFDAGYLNGLIYEQLYYPLSRVEGVATVTVYGGANPAFWLFVDPDKGNCAVCHSAPNFTDNGFHNIGLESWGQENPDMGRYAIKPIGLMKGAFKTPTLRDITLTAPYFHDGSAATLMDVVNHYETGGSVKTNLSPNMKALQLTPAEKNDLVAFMKALTTPPQAFTLPVIPPNNF